MSDKALSDVLWFEEIELKESLKSAVKMPLSGRGKMLAALRALKQIV